MVRVWCRQCANYRGYGKSDDSREHALEKMHRCWRSGYSQTYENCEDREHNKWGTCKQWRPIREEKNMSYTPEEIAAINEVSSLKDRITELEKENDNLQGHVQWYEARIELYEYEFRRKP